MGGDPDSFWRKTPREIRAESIALARRLDREHNGRAWLAWHIAALMRSKRMPKLDKLLAVDRDRKPMTPDALRAAMRRLPAQSVKM